MIRVKQSALSIAVKAALLGAMTVGIAACDSEGDVSTSVVESNTVPSNTIDNVRGTGSVSGVVVDTNNNFVEGATVTLLDKTATTNASGRYFFNDVPVAGVDGVNSENGAGVNEDHDAVVYVVTISSPAHANATVVVSPQDIQVDSTNNGSGAAGSGFESAPKQLVWFDGFNAEADVAVLPAINAPVKGFVRDCSTNAPIAAGTKVVFDFVGVSSDTVISDAQTIAGASGNPIASDVNNLTLGVKTIEATVGDDGSFMAMLPADSMVRMAVSGFVFSGDDIDNGSGVLGNTPVNASYYDINTTFEGAEQALGTIEVCAVGFESESRALTFNTLSGWTNRSITNAADGERYAMLNRDVNKVFEFAFNVPVDADKFNTQDVKVAINKTDYLDSATDFIIELGEDKKTLTLTLTEALGNGQKISVFIPYADTVKEGSGDDYFQAEINGGNTDGTEVDVTRNEADEIAGKGIYDFDSIEGNSGNDKFAYIQLNMCTFVDADINGDGISKQIFNDKSDKDANLESLSAYSSAFQDSSEFEFTNNADENNVVEQLNGQRDTGDKLSLLAQLITGDNTVTVNSRSASIEVDVLGSGKALVTDLKDKDGNKVDANIEAVSYDAGLDKSVYKVLVTENVSIEQSGSVKVVHTDGLGVSVKTETVNLVDNIPATTVIQDDYDLHAYDNDNSHRAGTDGDGYVATTTISGTLNFGNGGETSNKGEADKPGNPVIWIQPRHLAQKASNGSVTRGSEFANLVDASPVDSRFNRPLYDRNSISPTNYPAQAQQIGVAFSEDVKLIAGTSPVFGGTEVLDGYIENNNVNIDVDNNFNFLGDNNAGGADSYYSEDLVLFTTDDVIALANNNPLSSLKVIDFTDTVKDLAGNESTSAAEAKVVIADAMPPFVTRAEYDGITEQLVVWFNEPVQPRGEFNDGDLVLINPVDQTVERAIAFNRGETNADNVGYFALNEERNQLTVTISPNDAAAVFIGDANNNTAYFYDDDVDVNADDDAEQHAVLRWDGVADRTAERNEWAHFQNDVAGTPTAADRWKVDAPQFLAVDITVPFASTREVAYTFAGNDNTNRNASRITFTYNLNQPLDVQASFGFALPANVTPRTNCTGIDSTGNACVNGGGSYYDLTPLLPVSTTVDNDLATTETAFGGATPTTGLRLIDQNPGAVTVSNTAGDFRAELSPDLKQLKVTFETTVPGTDVFSGCALLVDATGTTITSTSNQTLDDGTFRSDSSNCASPFDSEGNGDQRPQ
jgi:hypothetical protein